jgi:hypothetical protein
MAPSGGRDCARAFAPGAVLAALLAGTTAALLAAMRWRGQVSETRLLLSWVCGVLPTLLVAAWLAERAERR